MKRCPQCEFVYEDDQSLCDMDGILLVFDSQKLPKPRYESKPKWRSRVVTGLAAVVLATVLLMVFYVTPNSQRSSGTNYRPAAVNHQPASDVKVDAPVPAPKVEEKATEKAPVSRSESTTKPKSNLAPKASPKPVQPKASSKKSTSTVSTQSTAKKNESKLGSLMRKTGKILKKPFRL